MTDGDQTAPTPLRGRPASGGESGDEPQHEGDVAPGGVAWEWRIASDAQRLLAGWAAPTATDARARTRILDYVAQTGAGSAARRSRSGHLTASAIVLDHTRTRVLLTLHHLARQWFQLGGHPEPGDVSLAEAARREATEESGIAGITIDPVPLGADWHAVTCRDDAGVPGPSQHLDVTFLALTPPGAEARMSEESLDLAWFDTDGLPGTADDPVRRCVAEALRRLG